jgi:uncharacterized damage-inducible protein DinB
MQDPSELGYVYEGWDGYHQSLVLAIAPLSAEQLAFRGSPEMRSVGEVALHIADGRVDWFRRLDAPLSSDLWSEVETRPAPPTTGPEIAAWLERTWVMVAATLAQWTVGDLPHTFEHPYHGTVYAVSRQWVVWRIMAHDIHHGGQLTELLAIQGVFPPELTYLGGHLTEPAVIREGPAFGD